jgi:hypothetical protein
VHSSGSCRNGVCCPAADSRMVLSNDNLVLTEYGSRIQSKARSLAMWSSLRYESKSRDLTCLITILQRRLRRICGARHAMYIEVSSSTSSWVCMGKAKVWAEQGGRAT